MGYKQTILNNNENKVVCSCSDMNEMAAIPFSVSSTY